MSTVLTVIAVVGIGAFVYYKYVYTLPTKDELPAPPLNMTNAPGMGVPPPPMVVSEPVSMVSDT